MKKRTLRMLIRRAALNALALCVASASLPEGVLSWLPLPTPKAADAETLTSPRYVSAAVLPNGQVGMVFLNVNGSSSEAPKIDGDIER